MKKILILLISTGACAMSLSSVSVWAQTEGRLASEIPTTNVVKLIEVVGNDTISLASILAKIKTRVGQDYLETVISDDLKRLYNTGYFSDVWVEKEAYEGGLKVMIHVAEKPVIEEITFSKIRHFHPRALLKKLKTKEGKFLDKKLLKDDQDTIKELYAQKGLTDASVDVETTTDDVTKKVKLHFVIREGYRIRIKRITVEGNTTFPDKRILKVIKARAKWWFIRPGYLNEEVIKEDVERITSFYEQNGYIDAKVKYSAEVITQGLLEITFHVTEGKQYFVGKITLKGNKVLSDLQIAEKMTETIQDGVFSRERLSVDLQNIRTLYFDNGYIFAEVAESTALNLETGKVEVKIDIKEGQPAYVRRIKVQGNTRTRDIVIRRELKLLPGEQFDGAKLRRSKERLENLGYFEEVGFDIEDTETRDKKDLVIQVKEAKTGTLSFGGGFSTVDQVVGFVELEQRNFDFRNWPTFTGGGQQLTLRGEIGSTRNNLFLSFTEPWLFDHPVSFGFDLYKTERDRERDTGRAYDEERLGGILRLGKEFSEYVSGGVAYKNEEVTIENFESGVSADLLTEGGTNRISTLGFNLERDSRDSVFNPTKGWFNRGDLDIAGGPLGGDKDFYRIAGRTSYYVPLKWKSVLEFKLRAGFVDAYGDSSKVPIFERFFAGGSNSIRGYEERGVGPIDSVNKDPLGGESLLVGNIEYTIPLIDFVKLAAFLDAGNVWADINDFASDEIKSGTGVGLRVKTPIGPVNLDYGYPLNDEPGEEGRSGKFYFSVSRGF